MTDTRRRRGKRGGVAARQKELRDIHSRIDGLPSGSNAGHAHNLKGSSATAAVADHAKFCDVDIAETVEDHVVPRQSRTRQLLLEAFPQKVETETIHGKQLDHRTGKMIEVTDQRVTWKSDHSLLRKVSPFDGKITVKREGSVSVGLNTRKIVRTETESPLEVTREIVPLPE